MTTIKGKTLEEINMMFIEASEAAEVERQKYFDAQWEALKEEIARQEDDMICAIAERAADLEWGQFMMENDNLEKEMYV